ncbi:Mbeg1-like protein [Schaalia suimastitidis]|uniref:Mbeg1-like protein n=1 Tax=Schaalia suimastitidis TaxID=121163 RepID=UPI0004189258|nr:Mbeg1-like protein [Schaalia suimastitidis]
MRWSDIARWDPRALEQLGRDIAAYRLRVEHAVEEVWRAENQVHGSGMALSAMLAASGRVRLRAEWYAQQLAQLAALTSAAGDGVREVRRRVFRCQDFADQRDYLTLDSEGNVHCVMPSEDPEDGYRNPFESDYHSVAEMAVRTSARDDLMLMVAEVHALAEQVDHNYRSGLLRIIRGQESPLGAGDGALDGRITKAEPHQRVLDLGDISYAIYQDHLTRAHNLPKGWSEVGVDELRHMGLDPSDFVDPVTGFTAALFRHENGDFVVAFRGSDEGIDWPNNLAGSLSVSPQQIQAIDVAMRVRSALESAGIGMDRLHFTGHSLGGGLAALASVATGSAATTFNAAGSSDLALEAAFSARNSSFGDPDADDRQLAAQRIEAFTSVDDPLSRAQGGSRAPDAFGTRIEVDPPGSPEAAAGEYRDTHRYVPPQVKSAVDAQTLSILIKQTLEAHGVRPMLDKLAHDWGIPR